jgi:hypothetical protein
MRSLLFTAAFFLACSSFLNEYSVSKNLRLTTATPKSISDLTVRRLSGERVFIAWHTEDDPQGIIYEVLRKHKAREQFMSLGIVSPRLEQGNTADYSFVDANGFADVSYYCIKKTNADSVIFYSVTKGVEGIEQVR